MSNEDRLPTADEIVHLAFFDLDEARKAAESALSWIRSDWKPLGTALTDEQYEAVKAIRKAAADIKHSVDKAKEGAGR